MKYLVVGGNGMLGSDLVSAIKTRGDQVKVLDLPDFDMTDTAQVVAQLRDADIVINCAAFTAVDAAEENEAKAFKINAVGPQLLARAAAAAKMRLIQISTDYVFDGTGSTPYGENDQMNPLGAYGRTKAAGEWAVRAETDDYLIIRTAWLYGAHGNCFPKTMARLATENETLNVVADQVGQPTWTVDLARLTLDLVAVGAPSGIYHGTAAGQTSWHGFTQAIMVSLGENPNKVHPATSQEFVRPAPRPPYSVLGHEALKKINVTPIGPWQERWNEAAPIVLAAHTEAAKKEGQI